MKNGCEMTNRWIDELSVTAREAIYEDIVFEANLDEHLAILFGVLQNFLEKAWLGGVSGNTQMEKSAVLGAIEVIGFLRSHLNPVSDHAANGVLRRFYNGAHRQIITAHRDGNFAELRVVLAQIKKLVELPYSKGFFQNCRRETAIDRKELVRFLFSAQVRDALPCLDHPIKLFQ